MGLREQAALDAQAILEDSSGFAWPFTLTSPQGVAAARVGFTQDIGQTIDPDTGQAVAGRRASVAVSLRSLPEMPVAVADSDRKPWIVSFASALGVFAAWKVIEVLPDRVTGVVVLLLEAYQHAVVVLKSAALGLPSLVLSGAFAPVVALNEATFVLPTPRLAGAFAPVVDLGGELGLPTPGLSGDLAPVVALSGSPTLPSGQLSGSLTVAVALSGAVTLPSQQLSGTFAPAVVVPGALTLPSMQLAGSFAPSVSVGGALALPSLQLSGSFSPTAALSGALTLPSQQLSGTFAPAVVVSGALTLPSQQLSGSPAPTVNLAGALSLPSAQVAGAFAPTVNLAGALTLPSQQLSGTATTPLIAGAMTLPSQQLSGTATTPLIAGAMTLPSQQLAGEVFALPTSAVKAWYRVANSTVTGAGVSSLPDVLNNNPAVQATDARRPGLSASANGLPILNTNIVGGGKSLAPPLIAANNPLVTWGLSAHVALDSVAVINGLHRTGNMASGGSSFVATDSHRVGILANQSIVFDVVLDAGGANWRRAATPAAAMPSSGYAHLTVQFNGGGATEADKVTITVDGVVQTLAFSVGAGTAPAMPSALLGTGGGLCFLTWRPTPTLFLIGRAGPNWMYLGAKEAGSTQALLTSASVSALMNFEKPT